MLKGGVIMDVVTPEHPDCPKKLALAPSWRWNASRRISRPGGVARMSDTQFSDHGYSLHPGYGKMRHPGTLSWPNPWKAM